MGTGRTPSTIPLLSALLPLLLLIFLPDVVLSLAARGPLHGLVLNLTSARSSPSHPLKIAEGSEPLELWCAPDNPQVTIKRIMFTRKRDNKPLNGTVSANKKNATLPLASATIEDAGEYSCELETSHGKLVRNIDVYARPVASSSHELLSLENEDPFKLVAPTLHVVVGQSVNLTCTILAHPAPAYKWTKDAKPIEMSDVLALDGATLRISSVKEGDEGEYACEAVNEYPTKGKTVRSLLSLKRKLAIRSAVAWIWPLLVILVTLILLVVIIAVCELRKKGQNKQARYVAQE